MLKMTNGQRIKYFRKKNKLTQKQLGLLMGFSESTADVRISQYESGQRSMKDAALRKLADIFKVSKGSISVHDIGNAEELMQFFFALEDYGMVSLERKGRYDFSLRLHLDKMPVPLVSYELLGQWAKNNTLHKWGRMSSEEYDFWRYCWSGKLAEQGEEADGRNFESVIE